jgi:antitoxin MazE
VEVAMITKIQKWGNSLAVRIPKSFAVEVGLEQNAAVEITMDDGKLILKPLLASPLSLADLISQITEQNLHGEVDTGFIQGNEAR